MYIKSNEIEKGFPAISEEDIKKFKSKDVKYIRLDRQLNIEDLNGKPSIFRIYYNNHNHTIYYDGKKIHDSWYYTNRKMEDYYDSSIKDDLFRKNILQQSKEQGYCAIFSIINSLITQQKQKINETYIQKFKDLKNSIYELGYQIEVDESYLKRNKQARNRI